MAHRTKQLAKDYHFIFMDIVGFSRSGITAAAQVQKLNFLNKIIRESKTINAADWNSVVKLPTGDGLVLGFSDSPEQPVRLAIEIDKCLKKFNSHKSNENRIDVRVGLHTAAVYKIKDINGMENVCGPGIIIARRIMDFGDAGHILASSVIAQNLIRLKPVYADMIRHIGRYLAKHEEPIEVYSISTQKIGNPKMPKALLEEKYGFIQDLRIERELEILDVKKMLVRHKHTRVFKNISENELRAWSSSIALDVPQSLNKLKLRAFDRDGKKLPIKFIVNTPLRKDYHIEFGTSISPGQIFGYTEYYEAREPGRYFEIITSGEVGLFEFSLVHPESARQLFARAYQIDPTGKKTELTEPESVKLGNKNMIRWVLDRSKKGTSIRFEW